MTTTLRPARDDDDSFLRAVYASTRAEELALVDWTPAQKQAFTDMQFDAQRAHYAQAYPEMSDDVILHNGQAAGRLRVARLPAEIRMVDLALLPEQRGEGIGTALLQDLMAEAQQARKPLTLHVEVFNPALHLYERLGFVKREDRGVYWFMEWRPPQMESRQNPHGEGSTNV
jgi:ribosomal protein S18 acetylase RimI-like enzyme